MTTATAKIFVVFAGLAAVVVATALSGCGESSPSGPRDVTIVYSNNMNGEIRSCGCASNDHGGLGRRATFIELQRRGAQDLMIFEGGDLFGDGINYGKEKADLTLQALRAMGYTGIVVGENDLIFGVDFLKERADALNLPVVAANLVDVGTNELVFPPTEVVQLPSGLRVGIIGVLDGVKLPEGAPADRYEISNARAAIDRYVPKLRDERKVDMVVVLAHMPETRLRQVMRALEGVDVIVAGHGTRAPRRAAKIGRAWLLQTSERGRYMGVARMEIDDKGKFTYFDTELDPLTTDYEDHQSIAKLFMTYDMDIRRKEKAGKPVPVGHAGARYAGAEACEPCHEEIYAQWKTTKHSHAFDILVHEERQYDRDCTPCHTAGFYELGGFLSIDETPDLIHVQCESCHGNSSRHAEDPDVKTPTNARDVCVTCHTSDQSPGFAFAEAWRKIRHESPDQSSGH